MKYCTNCKTNRESKHERYGYGRFFDSECWYCECCTLIEEGSRTIGVNCAAQLQQAPNDTLTYCQASGCFRQTYGNLCSEHTGRESDGLTGRGYSYAYSGAARYCPSEDCSRILSDGQDYCSLCQEKRALVGKVENKTSLSQVKDVEEFTTWWNNNLATVINGNSYFTVWLLVYDDQDFRIREFQESSGNYGLSNAKNKAYQLRSNLNGDNPILYIHPKANEYTSFNDLITWPYVEKIKLPIEVVYDVSDYYARLENPDNHIKPLDIVKVNKKMIFNYQHVGIYLGNEQVCHIAGGKDDGRGVRICDWGEFTENAGDMYRYRVLIPFKHYKQVIQQIAHAESCKWRENVYCLANQNCEHASNMFVYGVNFSEQAKQKSSLVSKASAEHNGVVNNNKTSINLKNEISQTNNQLGRSYNWQAQQIERRIVIPARRCWL